MDEERFTEPYQDPGWTVAISPQAGNEGLATLRRLFLSLLSAPFLILFILFMVIEDGVGEVSWPLAGVVVLLGLSGIAAAHWTSRRPLPIDSPGNLAAAHRTNFFLGFALNEAPLLVSFAFCFLEEAIWPYLIGFPLYLVGMALIAPGPRNIARLQQQILSQGSSMQMGRVLNAMPSS